MKLARRKTKGLPKKAKAPDTSWLCRYTDQQDQVTHSCTFHNCTKEEAAKSAERHAENMRTQYDSWVLTPLADRKS